MSFRGYDDGVITGRENALRRFLSAALNKVSIAPLFDALFFQ
ncbi:hypothetical protein PCC21_016710 [Pectobacterium carotovorum subsp. carotovorum PCC21]|nr:hypothetical protein PCC21_016710 [Pectobacterium carotovorum subsp. carotovorum PCC21]